MIAKLLFVIAAVLIAAAAIVAVAKGTLNAAPAWEILLCGGLALGFIAKVVEPN